MLREFDIKVSAGIYCQRGLVRFDRLKSGQCGRGYGQYIPALNSVNKGFIALLINPNNFIERIKPAQQNSPAKSSREFKSTLLIHGDSIHLS